MYSMNHLLSVQQVSMTDVYTSVIKYLFDHMTLCYFVFIDFNHYIALCNLQVQMVVTDYHIVLFSVTQFAVLLFVYESHL